MEYLDLNPSSILIECLRLVVLQEKDAIKQLRKIEKRIGVRLYTTPLRFRVPRRRPASICCVEGESLCDCWFEHEYIDYLQNGQCNKEMFSRICSNLENGQCVHFSGVFSGTAKIYLIHAAVATNNRKVTKYISRQIMKRSNTLLNDLTTGAEYLTALHIAVLKGSGEALQYVIDLYAAEEEITFYETYRNFFLPFGHVSNCISKRNDITGNVETFELKGGTILTYLLAHCKSPSQMKILFQFLPSLDQEDFEYLINEYLSTGNEEFACIVLNDSRTSNMRLDSTILLNAIFLHAHDFIFSWIRHKRSLAIEVKGVKIHALLIPEALGCQKCISLMCRGVQKNRTTQNELDTYGNADVSPFVVACYIADKFNYDSDILIKSLETLHFTISRNIQKRNNSFGTVLHELVKPKFCKTEVLTCLLELGCDVNASDGEGRTPLQVLLESRVYSADTVKCLLEHGADVNKTDLKGQTPFLQILEHVKQKKSGFDYFWIYRPTLDQVNNESVECLKFILYFNPRVDIHPDVLYQAKTISCYEFKGYINLPLVPSDESVCLFAILMEMGFINYHPDDHDESFGIRLYMPLENRGTECDDYYQQFISQPRSLQSICRVGIRKAFPGYRLHKLFQQYHIPKKLREYILFENILFFRETLSRRRAPEVIRLRHFHRRDPPAIFL